MRRSLKSFSETRELMSMSAQQEVILNGGSTNAGLVSRIGDTVRRPRRPTGAATKALLDYLEALGFAGAPQYLGSDDQGREVLTYIPGQAAIEPHPPWVYADEVLVSVAQLVRSYHDAVAGFDPSPYEWPHPLPPRFRGGIVSHNDPNLDNVIFRAQRAVALIDFDLASPGSTAWDLACAARLWVPLREPRDAPAQVRGRMLERLALFADAYGASRQERTDFVEAAPHCHRWCYAVVQRAVASGHKTFSRQWQSGGRERAERTGRWLSTQAPRMRHALGLR
jgi:Phosphotransferase enzyme family